GPYTVTPNKSGYVFSPASQAITLNGADARADFSAALGPTADRANSYDNAWKAAWVAHARDLLRTPGKTNGFVLEIGDSLTRSVAYATWPAQGEGQTPEDLRTLSWARATTWS